MQTNDEAEKHNDVYPRRGPGAQHHITTILSLDRNIGDILSDTGAHKITVQPEDLDGQSRHDVDQSQHKQATDSEICEALPLSNRIVIVSPSPKEELGQAARAPEQRKAAGWLDRRPVGRTLEKLVLIFFVRFLISL